MGDFQEAFIGIRSCLQWTRSTSSPAPIRINKSKVLMYYDIMWRQEDVRKTSSFLGGGLIEKKAFAGYYFLSVRRK